VSDDLLIAGRISLMVTSLIVIFFIIKAKNDQRLGNQFFIIMMIFWSSVFIIAIKPDILDSVLNTTGFVNRSQFLLSISVVIILYLLYLQTKKSKTISGNFNQMIRNISIISFKRELDIKKIDSPELVIVIVAKNESNTIGDVIDKINSLNLVQTHQIIVVNDGSTDETEKISREKNTLVVTHLHNLGIGAATKTGLLACRLLNPKIVITVDADGQHDPKSIPQIVSKIKDEGADLVYVTRFSDQSDYKTTKIRSLGNKFYTNLTNKIAKISITDVTTGYRGIRFDKIKSIFFLAETNFAIEYGIRAGRNHLKIMEISAKTTFREFGHSQFQRIEKFLVYNINALNQIINAVFRKAKFD